MWQSEIAQNVRRNFTVNVLDAAFFGLALGIAGSSGPTITLFLNSIHASTILISLASAFHDIGWQLPQMLTSNYVARLQRYKPMVMFMTIHERWPFFGLAVLALLIPVLGDNSIGLFAFLFLTVHALGGGFAATAWQSMIGKIMPRDRRATFFGIQSGVAALLGAGGALAAGILVEKLPSPYGFVVCFGLAGVAMMISLAFLGQTREAAHDAEHAEEAKKFGWRKFWEIFKRDVNFRWFLVARIITQVAWMGSLVYVIYAVRVFKMSPELTGIMTGVLLIFQTVANPLLGWVGDRWGYRMVMVLGALTITLSAALALFASSVSWFYLVFALTGISKATVWGVTMTFILEFGSESEKPLYVGLANTPMAIFTILVPLFGGWVSDNLGFGTTFTICVIAGLMTAFMLYFIVRDPQPKEKVKKSPSGLALEDSGVW